MIFNDPNKDWLYEDEEKESENSVIKHDRIHFNKKSKKRKKKDTGKKSYSLSNKIKYRWNNFKNKLRRRTHRRINLPLGLILSLFIPLLVGLLVVYLLFPGFSVISGYFGSEFTIHLLLIFLLIPAEVSSYVPWIAWIASGFVGGFLSRKILIPFFSMYGLIWLFLIIIEGDLFFDQLSMFSSIGLDQIIFQILIVNLIFSLLAFGFGGWIGSMFGGETHSLHVKKSTAVVVVLVIVGLVIGGLFYIGFFDFLSGPESVNLGDSITEGDLKYTFVSAGWEKYQYGNDEYFYLEVKAENIGKEEATGYLSDFVYEMENGYKYEDTYKSCSFIVDPGRNETEIIKCSNNIIDKEFLPVAKVHFKVSESNPSIYGTTSSDSRDVTLNLI